MSSNPDDETTSTSADDAVAEPVSKRRKREGAFTGRLRASENQPASLVGASEDSNSEESDEGSSDASFSSLSDAVAAAAGASSGGAASAASFEPTFVLVKLGEHGYFDVRLSWQEGAHMTKGTLLEALSKTSAFGPLLQGVALAACRVYVFKGELADEEEEPDAVIDEGATDGHTLELELKAATTLGEAAQRARLTGKRLFIRVSVPDSKPPQPAAVGLESLLSYPALPDTHRISQVVAAIRSGKVTDGAIGPDGARGDGHLRLPDGLSWPVATNNVLYVRKFYAPLLENVLNFCKAVRSGKDSYKMRRIVTGQPGIGKSVWVWYVVYRMLRERPHRTIIVVTWKTKKVFIIPPQGAVRMSSLRKFDLEKVDCLQDLGTDPLLIADSLLPPELDMPTLVVSSPGRLANRDLKETLDAYEMRWYYMPIPTEEEVLDMRAACFGGVDEGGVKRRLALWGPIPRHVLVRTSLDNQKVLWERAAAVNLDALVELARGNATGSTGVGDELDAPHRLVHERAAGQDAAPNTPAADITRADYYHRGNVVLASPSMVLYVANRLVQEAKWNVKFLIDASVGIGPLGALRGLKFEDLALQMLEDGAEFMCRRLKKPSGRKSKSSTSAAGPTAPAAAAFLHTGGEGEGDADEDDDKVTTLKVAATQRITWASVDGLSTHKSTRSLLVPRKRNEAGLDALVWDDGACHHWPLDCTVAERHAVHAQGIADAVQALGWVAGSGWPAEKGPKDVKYFWVVPEDRFNSIRTEQEAKKGSDDSPAAQEVFQHMRQYVLCPTAASTTLQIASVLAAQGVRLPKEMLSGCGEEEAADGSAVGEESDTE